MLIHETVVENTKVMQRLKADTQFFSPKSVLYDLYRTFALGRIM